MPLARYHPRDIDTERSWQPYLVTIAAPFFLLGLSVWIFKWPRRALPAWFRESWDARR